MIGAESIRVAVTPSPVNNADSVTVSWTAVDAERQQSKQFTAWNLVHDEMKRSIHHKSVSWLIRLDDPFDIYAPRWSVSAGWLHPANLMEGVESGYHAKLYRGEEDDRPIKLTIEML